MDYEVISWLMGMVWMPNRKITSLDLVPENFDFPDEVAAYTKVQTFQERDDCVMIHARVDGQLCFNSWCANRISNVFGARLRCVDLISGYDYEMPKKQVARGGGKVQKFEFQSRLEASPRFGLPNPHHWIFRRSSFQFIIEAFHSELFAPGKRGLIHRITMGLV